MSSKLEETGNLLRLFVHYSGLSEVPHDFLVWAFMSAMSACVADRVYMYKFNDEKLVPNMYVALIGPSGIGKEIAIRKATKFVAHLPQVNFYRGKTTAPYLIDYLSRPKHLTKLYLVTPELAMSVGKGEKANDFVKFMTDIYGGSYTLQEGTRTSGSRKIIDPNMVWLFGTTKQWLFESVSREAILSGFFARIAYVEADYDLAKRVTNPTYPEDVDEVREHLQARMNVMARTEGEFTMTADAEMLRDEWYRNRPAPDDEAMIPSWKREDDFVLKVAMLLSLSDDFDLRIKRSHMYMAQRFSRDLTKKLPTMVASALSPERAATMQLVISVFEKVGRIPHSALLRIVGSRGVMAEELKLIIGTLKQQGRVLIEYGAKSGAIYTWTGRRTKADPPQVEEPAQESS